MKEIQLTQGKVALVDDEDFDFLNKWKWHAAMRKNVWYAMRSTLVSEGKKRELSMHRVIMNTQKGMIPDHKDHDGLNCQKHNLRNCSVSENQRNTRKISGGNSKYKGVIIVGGKYIMAQIMYNYKNIYLGYFKTEIEAAKAYDEKAKELFGEFACLNFK